MHGTQETLRIAHQRAFSSERVDPSLVVDEASEAILALAESDGVTIEAVGDVSLAVGSPALLFQVATGDGTRTAALRSYARVRPFATHMPFAASWG